jgi:UDP-glucuronate 4-epimerase
LTLHTHGDSNLGLALIANPLTPSLQVPFSEADRVDRPASLYAATKKANEMIAHTYNHIYGLSTTGLRFFTVYGPYGRPDMAYFSFTNDIMAGKPIKIFQGPGGSELVRNLCV